MGQGDHWSVWECEDYLKHPEKYQISPKNLLFRVHVEVCNKLLHLPFHPVSHRLDLFCYKVLKGSQKCMFADPPSLHDGLRITWNSNITINNDNWTEWSTITLQSYFPQLLLCRLRRFSFPVWARKPIVTQFRLKSQVLFQTKIARHEVQLPLYYIHFEIAQMQDLVNSNMLFMQYWAGF